MTCRARVRGVLALATLTLGALGGCTSSTHEPGVSVEVEMTQGVDDALEGVRYTEGEPRGFENDLGFGFVVQEAQLVLSALELVPCEAGAVSRFFDLMTPVSVAHAHGTVSPWAYAVPQVIDLMSEDLLNRPLAVIEPPPGRYCALRLYSGPADDDARGIEDFPELVGLALRVTGSSVTSGLGPRALTLVSAFEQEVEVPLGVDGLKLSAAAFNARLRLRLSYAAIFDGLDPHNPDAAYQAYTVQENLLMGITLVECEAETCTSE